MCICMSTTLLGAPEQFDAKQSNTKKLSVIMFSVTSVLTNYMQALDKKCLLPDMV